MKKLANKPFWLWMWLCVVGLFVPIQLVADDYYLIGSFTNNWDMNSAIKLTPNGNQYEIKQSFNQGDEFKIVKNKDWNQSSWGYSNVNDKSLVENKDGNAKIKATGCYGLFFKPSDNTIYITKSSDCPQPYSLWGFDFLYQEGGSSGTKKWASTKGSADAWDGNFIATSADGETFDLGVIKRKSRFIGFRFYTNSNGAEVNGANVIWRNTDNNVKAIEGSDYGKWSNDGTKASTVAGTDAVWHQTDRNNALLGYENGTYSFDLVFELKVNNQEKKEVRTIHITYTINEFELTTNLSGPCHVGDLVQLNISGGTAPYTWQSSNDGISWSTLSGASGTAYTHKVADKTFIRAKDSNGNITNVVELTPSIRCDQDHTITIFKETFGTLSGEDARASYSKNNVPVEGTNITYTASVPYTASTVSCGAMTDGGYYAVLANPRNAGCGTNIAQGTQNCNCVDEVGKDNTRWYRNTTDHTGDTNGGMLMYNCKDGTSTTDVLYECIINGLCDSTYINFSAFVTCANRGLHGNIPIEAEFKLFNAANNVEIDTYEVKNIGLSEEWKEISAMFNSGAATSVKIQLINKAGDGQGNDLLFDDMTLSICTPEANLVCSDGVSTESVIVAGGSETLTASVLSGVMNKPYYLWQYQVGRANWVSMGEPQRDHATITVTPESSPTKYRVILANSIHEAKAVADGSTGKACGVHAITNEATVYAAFVTMSAATSVGNICLDGEDPSQLTLTITNPSGIEINNLKVNVGIPTNYINKVTVASGTGYSNNVWNVGTLANGASKTLKLNLKSDAATDEAVKEVDIKPYVSQLNNQTWANYDDSPTKSSAKLALNQVTKTPTAVTDYFECAETGTLTLSSLVNVEKPENLVFYDGETSLTTVSDVSKSDTSIDKYYYFTYQEGTKCVSKRGKVHVKIIPVPTASITSGESQTVCAAEKYTFDIAARATNGTGVWEVTSGSAEIDKEKSATTTACVLAGKTATLTWTVSNEKCGATASTTLSVDEQPKVTLLDGKGSASICGKSEFTVGVNTTASAGTWSIVEGSASASIQSPNDKETLVTGVEAGKTVKLKYTATNGTCDPVDSELVVLTNLVCNQFVLDNKFANETIGKGICLNQETTLTVTITNSSMATSTNVKTSVKLPAGLTYVTHSGSGTYNKDTGLWLIPSLEKGEDKKAQLVITVKGTTAATHKVTATITEATGTPVSGMSIPASITVHALPSVAFDATQSTICIDEQDKELTNIKVNFTGAAPFDITYQVDQNTAVIKKDVPNPYYIKETLTGNSTITLLSVVDTNGCDVTPTANQTHTVTTKTHASLGDLTTPPAVCEGSVLALTAPTVTNNKGAEVTNPTWFLDGKAFDPATTVTNALHNDKELYYQITSSCNNNKRDITTPAVKVTVDAKPVAFAGTDQTKCNNDAFVMAATVPEVGSGKWSVISGTANIQEPTSATTGVVGVPVNESATLQWTVSNGVCEANSSTVVLTNNDCTKLNLTTGTAPVVCDGNEATFTFTLTNGSSVTTTDVTSVITLGAGLSDAIITTNNGTISGNTWTVASMAPGDESVLTVVANATTADASVQVIVLTASGVSVAAVSANQSATVHALPSAAFDITSSTICIDEQDKELTNIKVNFTGAPDFNLTYKVNNGSDITKTNVSSPYSIKEQLSDDATISLVSVTDAKGCTGTITNQSHTVTTQQHASLGKLTAPEGVCDGGVLDLTAPTVTNNKGAVVTNPTWFLGGNEFDPATTVTNAQHNGKELFYQITSTCNAIERNISSNTVGVTVYKTPELDITFTDPNGNEVTATQISCAIPYLTATLSGAETYTWTDGSTQNPRVLGQKGQTTTYQVTGVTAQNCTSAPLTVTVTEDFVTPDVAIAVSDADKKITCSVQEITLTASSSTAGVTYKWDDADETSGAIVKVATPNTYKVTATNSTNGCSATATETIGINTEKPVIVITSKDANGTATSTLNCTAEASALTLVPSVTNVNSIGGPVTFVWDGDNTIPTERTVNEAKRYTVAATGANGCAASQFIDITLDDDVPTLDLTASAADITCLVQSSVLTAQATPSAGVTYAWNTNESGSQITVNAGGKYEVVATAVNGCTVTKSVTIDQHTDLPNVTISSTDPKQYCRVNTLTASGADKYVWNTNEQTTSIEVSEGGEYWVEGTNAYGCSARAELNLENDKETPVVAISSDINAITCTNTTATLTATVTNADDARTYSYEWSPKSGTNSTLRVTEGKTYKVVVTDGTNYCKGEKTIAVAQHTEKPMVDVQTLPAVCLPATIDLAQAIGPNTLADNVVFFEDEALTKEITNTTIDLAQYNVFYVQGQQVNGNGCMGDAQPVAANVKAVTPAPVVKDYDECTKAGSEKFSSLVTSGYYKLNFYASENDETPIADAFDASASNTTTTYYVSNTNQGACESERVPFTVHIEGLVDFELEVSETNVLAGGNQVVVTLMPASVEVDQYKWMANGNVLPVEGEEYSANLYIDTKFEVAAKGRCNTLVKEAFVEVVWPTAFTPYNNNNLNETFAKGLPVKIFNRFGVLVFEGPDGWDGVMNKNMGANNMAVPGVYYYAVPLPDGNVKKGTIEIVKF